MSDRQTDQLTDGRTDTGRRTAITALTLSVARFLVRLPKVDLIILEGKNVRPYVRPSVHKKFLRFE